MPVSDLLSALGESGKRVGKTGQGRKRSQGRTRFLAQSQPQPDAPREFWSINYISEFVPFCSKGARLSFSCSSQSVIGCEGKWET